ncbi:MAG TPA: Ig-like domain-containing protein [Candidatus Aquicultor sp.]|jgi:hypothetical protein
MQKKFRLIALLLVCALVLTLVPVYPAAAEQSSSTPTVEQTAATSAEQTTEVTTSATTQEVTGQNDTTTTVIKEETDTAAAYTGSWETTSSSDASGGTYTYSNDTSASAAFSFYGTEVAWIAGTSSSAGIAKVKVDGTYQQDVDLYGDEAFQRPVYNKTGLELGIHTITITVSGLKNESSTGTGINIDAFKVVAPVITAPPGSPILPVTEEPPVPPVIAPEDTTSPSILITGPQENSTISDKTPVLSFAVSEPATVTVTLDDVAVETRNGDELPALSEETHAVTITATDPSGNQGTASTTFKVDTTAPTASASLASGLFNALQHVTLTASEDAVIYYTVDGTPPSAMSTRYLGTPIPIVATTALEFMAVDTAGNRSPIYTERYAIDTNAPVIIGSDPIGGLVEVPVDKTITVAFREPVRAGASYEAISIKDVNGVTVAATTNIHGNTLTITPNANLAHGAGYTVSVPVDAIQDAAGNTLTEPFGVTFITSVLPDTTAPSLTITSPVSGSIINNNTPSLQYFIDDPSATVFVTVNGIAVDKISGDELDTLTEGVNTVRIKAIDSSGNSSVADAVFTVDTIAPGASAMPKGDIYRRGQSVELSASEAATLYYTTDGTAPDMTSNVYVGVPININETATLKFMAVDVAGNQSPVYSETYTIDGTPPKVANTDPTDGATGVLLEPKITVTFSEPVQASDTYDKITLTTKEGKSVDFTKDIADGKLIIQPKSNLATNTHYVVTVPGGAVMDIAGNGFAEQYALSFITAKSPGEAASEQASLVNGANAQQAPLLSVKTAVRAVRTVVEFVGQIGERVKDVISSILKSLFGI